MHHQKNDLQERALRAVHHPEPGQGTPCGSKSTSHVCPSSRCTSLIKELMLQLKSTTQLLGRDRERILLFELLIPPKEGDICLEDLDGIVELDSSLPRDTPVDKAQGFNEQDEKVRGQCIKIILNPRIIFVGHFSEGCLLG